MHATPRLTRTDEEVRQEATTAVQDNNHRHGSNVSGNQASVDEAVSVESTSSTTPAEPSPADKTSSSTEVASVTALARLTTLARPWSVTETKSSPSLSLSQQEEGTVVVSIQKTFHFDTFEDAFMFMTRIAFYASQINHHPRMFNFWNRVRLTLSSYDNVRKLRIVSGMDVEMATFAEKVCSSLLDRRKSDQEASVGSGSNKKEDRGNGSGSKLSDILAEELNRRGSDSYTMVHTDKGTGSEKRKAMLKALRDINKKNE
ncbi:hypothetical protein V1525DRAFT_279081 [Lipomyces kononenkoae]|uniref:Uncharacterized protein n=1 Tax=Lipomyces kononenkoae TaxID=34357 RepID=A0ACC3T8W2_LIPKO